MARRASRLAGGAAAARTGGGDSAARPRDGIITGYLLKQIRQSAGLSQEGLAEQLGVDPNTVQGWETGRRSLTGTRVATLVELRHRLRQLGADAQLIAALEDAPEADYVLAYTLGIEPGAGASDAHPLACWVPKRSFGWIRPSQHERSPARPRDAGWTVTFGAARGLLTYRVVHAEQLAVLLDLTWPVHQPGRPTRPG